MSTTNAVAETPARPDPSRRGITYGRSRLLLGVSGVGTWVVFAVAALALGLPDRLNALVGGSLAGSAAGIGLIAGTILIVQACFDIFGGHLLPRRHDRSQRSPVGYLLIWSRGVIAYSMLFFVTALLMLIASSLLGGFGYFITTLSVSLLLLALRTPLSRLIGGIRSVRSKSELGDDVRLFASDDVGFTGGISGVFAPRRHLIPARWAEELSAEALELAVRKRRESVASGLWLKGRVGALLFTWAGAALAGAFAHENGGTAGGILTFACVYTLWAFFGLLVLPTLSRRASQSLDTRLTNDGVSAASIRDLASQLDAMQDDEPDRPGWIQAIFHPIPNVTSRIENDEADRQPSGLAAYDIARTSAFLGMSGLSPLGRSVHCNSGRPPLWVYLPLD